MIDKLLQTGKTATRAIKVRAVALLIVAVLSVFLPPTAIEWILGITEGVTLYLNRLD